MSLKHFKKSFDLLLNLEFNDASNALHKNPNEDGLTFMGIYEVAHPNWVGWEKVHNALDQFGDMKKASRALYNSNIVEQVEVFYKNIFWDKLRLDEVDHEIMCKEIFLFAVNAGLKVAIKTAQRVLGIYVDGIIGPQTIKALNNYDPEAFDSLYDEYELKYYDEIIARNPKFKIYAKGWRNRALSV